MRYILLHGHIFKNAGSTMDWSLQRIFGDRFLDHRQDKPMRQAGRELLAQLVEQDEQLCALSSHHMTGDLPQIRGVNFISVNLLRHPLIRLRSVYDFERHQQGETPGARAAKQKGFRDYVAWRMQPDVARTIRNYQTLYLAGRHHPTDNAEIARHYFSAALAKVASGAFVGVVERYDESMVVLEEQLRGIFPAIDLSYVRQNVSAGRKVGETEERLVAAVLSELGDLQKQVIDENSFDLALYQAGSAALQSKMEGVENFALKLANFRQRCASL